MNLLDKLKSNLPKVHGILGKDEFFNSAVLIPLVFVDDEYHFLFEKRSANIKQGGEICFPGGRVEKTDKSVVHTALRETFEEIGIEKNKINVIGKLNILFGPRGVLVEPIIAEVKIDNLQELIIDKSEVEKVFLVPLSFFENNEPEHYKIHSTVEHKSYNPSGEEDELILPSNNGNDTYYKSIRDVMVYKTQGEIIWGITARLVYEVIEKLKVV
ncbi:MAG: CoA pyrophosphatase [Melioribacteraceae bacterium]|jgi:coenzyme A diphosphatase NUDT7|nr:CoA pyrophosphatase [Melioribacteraceae bacterium]